MFTGIITDIGRLRRVVPGGSSGPHGVQGRDMLLEIACAYDPATIAIGASIACSGCCLTAIEVGGKPGDSWFAVQASGETLSKTTLGSWREGTRINLERALKMGDELGGHIVSGHVDGLATLVSLAAEGESTRLVFGLPISLGRFVAPKGSVAIEGVSLTVNEVSDAGGPGGSETRFGVNIIPHTQTATTLGGLRPGQRVNFEVDMLARYVQRLAETSATKG